MMNMMPIASHAVETNEAEPNDTYENAQLIFANSETAAGCVNGTYVGQRVIKGTISSSDTDWYKVDLAAGTQYVTCSGAAYTFYVYRENNLYTPVFSDTYTNAGFGVSAHAFTAPVTGTYYVKLVGISPATDTYRLLVGGPTYDVSELTRQFGTIRLVEADEDYEHPEYLHLDFTLPDDAIVYSFSIYNLAASVNNGVIVTNYYSNNVYNLPANNLNKTISPYSNVPLRAPWTFTIKFKKVATVKPRVVFRYVYPVTSQMMN